MTGRMGESLSVILAGMTLILMGAVIGVVFGWGAHQQLAGVSAASQDEIARTAYYRALFEYCLLGETAQDTPLAAATVRCGNFVQEAAAAALYESPIEGYEVP